MNSGRNGDHGDAQSESHHGASSAARQDRPGSLEQWPISRLLSTAARLWEREIADDLRAARLSPSSLTALQALAETGTTNQAKLARHIHITAQSLGRTLSKLEGIGYIRKSIRTIGRRDISISITAAGARALAAIRQDTPRGTGADLTATQPERTLPITALRKDLVELLQHITLRSGTP